MLRRTKISFIFFNCFYKRFVSFGLTFALGLFVAAFFYGTNVSSFIEKKNEPVTKIVVTSSNRGRSGSGSSGADFGPDDPRNFQNNTLNKTNSKPETTVGIKILTKPRAFYTEQAKANLTQGKVVLRVTFKTDGKIGVISVISGLPDGLTEAAIEAAKKIKFEPAERDGKAITMTKPIEYTFTIY